MKFYEEPRITLTCHLASKSHDLFQMRRVQYLWYYTSVLPMIDGEVDLTLVLTVSYITLMILIGPLMRLLLTKLENIDLIIITGLLMLSPRSSACVIQP